MVERYSEKDFNNLFYFLRVYKNSDFYDINNNDRVYINSKLNLKQLLKKARNVFVTGIGSDIYGIILTLALLEQDGKTIKNFVKINTIDKNIGEKLITVLLWNINTDLYIRIKNYSPLRSILERKGFRLIDQKHNEILLFRSIKNFNKSKEVLDEPNNTQN